MRIVNPSFGLASEADVESETRPVDWSRDSIILFGNAKPNARELLEGIRASMAAFRSIEEIAFVAKDSPAQPAPPEMIENIAQTHRAALLALAD